ncbi:uncharacterized protein LOC121371468 isoform X2 [Gigantopelta aegis]|uniref:uncharacterized protein LOC121371468 isoform X2 n=1 Tax=Gigantopelta aegis TaxID=1735272 RepID=UPI001B889789|nr:uncharacterized protein LOC121371468 isoform X2 [Gigantopelta aegis]
MIKIAKAIEGSLLMRVNSVSKENGNKHIEIEDDSEETRNILYDNDDHSFKDVQSQTRLKDRNMSNSKSGYPWTDCWHRRPSKDSVLEANTTEENGQPQKVRSRLIVPKIVIEDVDEVVTALPNEDWNMFEEIGRHFIKTDEFKDIATNVFAKRQNEPKLDRHLIKVMEGKLQNADDHMTSIGPELTKCLNSVDACSSVLGILKQDLNAMHKAHKIRMHNQKNKKKKDKDEIKKLKNQMDQLTHSTIGMEKKLNFIEDAEKNSAVLEAYEKLNGILTDIDSERKRNRETVEQWSITTTEAAENIRKKMIPFENQRNELQDNMKRLSEEHDKMMSLINQSRGGKPKGSPMPSWKKETVLSWKQQQTKFDWKQHTSPPTKRQGCPNNAPVNLYNKERHDRWKPESRFTDEELKKDIATLTVHTKTDGSVSKEEKACEKAAPEGKANECKPEEHHAAKPLDEMALRRKVKSEELREWYETDFKTRRDILKMQIEQTSSRIDSMSTDRPKE